MEFGRLLTAMVTAFDDEGALDLNRQTKLIEHLIHTGTETIVVTGTTGESPTLTTDEKSPGVRPGLSLRRQGRRRSGAALPAAAGPVARPRP